MKPMEVKLYKVYDSRTSETVLALADGIKAQAPAGKSVGTYEVVVAPDGVDKAIQFAKKKVLSKIDFGINQKDFDNELEELCGENFSKSGSGVSLSLSILNLKLLAHNKGKQVYELYNKNPKKEDFPTIFANTIGGGLHSANKIPIQEILGISKNKDFIGKLESNIQFYKNVEKYLKDKKIFFGKNDEGAYSFKVNYKKALDIAKVTMPTNFSVGVDMAANSYFKNGKYVFGNSKYSERKYFDLVSKIIEKYNLFYIEDPFNEDSFDLFSELTAKYGKDRIICGDDLFVTNESRLKEGIKNKSANGIIIKPNQIGCITKTKKVVDLAIKSGIKPVISHRSGETTDTIISQLDLGWKIPYIKESLKGGERISKINELVMLYNDLYE